MKNKKAKGFILVLICIIIVILVVIRGNGKRSSKDLSIVTSFYPMYILTLNITDGAENVNVQNMASDHVGCIHDYTLTTNDLKILETANVFIQNGNGLENFTNQITENNSDLKIINAGENVTNLIYDSTEVNPHIWMDIDNYIEEVKNVTEKLKEINPDNKKIYESNMETYLEQLNKVKTDNENVDFTGFSAVCLNEGLEYFLNDVNFNVIAIETDHENSTLSANQVREIIDNMNSENIKYIFIDKNDDTKNADMIATETGAQVIALDSAMQSDAVYTNAYIMALRNNYTILKQLN